MLRETSRRGLKGSGHPRYSLDNKTREPGHVQERARHETHVRARARHWKGGDLCDTTLLSEPPRMCRRNGAVAEELGTALSPKTRWNGAFAEGTGAFAEELGTKHVATYMIQRFRC